MSGRKIGTTLCCAIGACGAIACSVAMFAVPLGIVGASAATVAKASTMQSMSDMSSMPAAHAGAHPASLPSWIALLDRFGPELLAVSMALVLAAMVVRRSTAGGLLALLAGIVLYFGMYGPVSLTIMWIATGTGFALLIASLIAPRVQALRQSRS